MNRKGRETHTERKTAETEMGRDAERQRDIERQRQKEGKEINRDSVTERGRDRRQREFVRRTGKAGERQTEREKRRKPAGGIEPGSWPFSVPGALQGVHKDEKDPQSTLLQPSHVLHPDPS